MDRELKNSMKSVSINSSCNNSDLSSALNGCCISAKATATATATTIKAGDTNNVVAAATTAAAEAAATGGAVVDGIVTATITPMSSNNPTSPVQLSSAALSGDSVCCQQQQQQQFVSSSGAAVVGRDIVDASCAVNASASVVVTSSFCSASTKITQQSNSAASQPLTDRPTPCTPYANSGVADKRKMVHEACQQLILTDEQIKELNYRILNEIKKGLAKDTHTKANVKCFVTYVQDLPNGNERGKFLALDLGGTNFRVLLIHLKEEHEFQMESRIYAIPQHIMIGSGIQLFDHIAECLANFMSEHDVYKERLPLGFTFSFPLHQVGLTKGLLVTWTKGFNCEGVVDEDVVQLLKDAIARRGDVQIDVCAILNDTTGTLMSCAWKNHNCKIGLIVGTGSNACYVERVEEAELFDAATEGKPHVLINTEWGAFGDNGALDFVRTEYDEDIDKFSINPGKQVFEKMISGMYMGELVRLVIVRMVRAGVLFHGQDSDVLMTRGLFFTKYVSEIEADEPGNYSNCRLVLEELGLNNATDGDCANVRYICECVSRRAAHLVSCGIATLINKMNEPKVTVGVDGSVYRFHPKFHNLMVEKISQLINPGITFDLMLSEDGSGRGAALVAAVACRENYPRV